MERVESTTRIKRKFAKVKFSLNRIPVNPNMRKTRGENFRKSDHLLKLFWLRNQIFIWNFIIIPIPERLPIRTKVLLFVI